MDRQGNALSESLYVQKKEVSLPRACLSISDREGFSTLIKTDENRTSKPIVSTAQRTNVGG